MRFCAFLCVFVYYIRMGAGMILARRNQWGAGQPTLRIGPPRPIPKISYVK